MSQIRKWSKSRIWSFDALFLISETHRSSLNKKKDIFIMKKCFFDFFLMKQQCFCEDLKGKMKNIFFEKSCFTPNNSRHFDKKYRYSLILHAYLKGIQLFYFFGKKQFSFFVFSPKAFWTNYGLHFSCFLLKSYFVSISFGNCILKNSGSALKSEEQAAERASNTVI